MFRIIRRVLGAAIIFMGFVGVYMAIAIAAGWMSDNGVGIVGNYLFGDLFLIVGNVVWGRSPFKRKPSFTSPIIAILVWIIGLALYPVTCLFTYIKDFFRWLKNRSRGGSRSHAHSQTESEEEEEDPRSPAGESKVRGAVNSLCRNFHGYDDIGYATKVEYSASASYFSHLITLEIHATFSVRNSDLTSEYEVEREKSAIEDYQSRLASKARSLQQDVISAIENLQQQYSGLDDEWKVEANIKTDAREV